MAKFKLVYCEHFCQEEILLESDHLSKLFLEASSHLSSFEDLETFLKSVSYFEIDDFDDNCLIDLHLLLLENKGFFSFFNLSELFY